MITVCVLKDKKSQILEKDSSVMLYMTHSIRDEKKGEVIKGREE